MSPKNIERRDFIKYLLGSLSLAAFNWNSFPTGSFAKTNDDQYDAIIIGSGLGGLSCGAAFARQGFKPLVIEQHYIPGGYATAFKRKGFTFDASLHSTTVGERNGIYNLISGFPEITDVEFLPHRDLYRIIFPKHDICVPQKDVDSYIKILMEHFPEEKDGIKGLFDDMEGYYNDIQKISGAGGEVDMSRFAVDYPFLSKFYNVTWGKMLGTRIKNTELSAILSGLWGYFGLPPSRLTSLYYALPTLGYLKRGGYYPRGRSQDISNAFSKYIEDYGGKVMLKTKVEEILIKNHMAYGVKTKSGQEFKGKVVVSNANVHDTFHTMMKEDEFLKDYFQKIDNYSVSLSCFQVFLGLKKELIKEIGIQDSEIFGYNSYDLDAEYDALKKADMENSGFSITLYDNIYNGYSPEGKNTINILALQGFDHWEKFEKDYFKGNKGEYRKEKERMADVLINRIEKTLLPGLSSAIEVKEIGTPLTHMRYTSNYRGAIYGFDQTLDNYGLSRLPHKTPIKNLYLAGAWTQPGHGYGAVIPSGIQCFGEIMKEW